MARRKPKLEVIENKSGYISPHDLHDFLPITQTREITFATEKKMRSYRAMLYSVNKQATHRYRTIRGEGHMYSLIIWRML